jgi:hypothetical protein
MRVEAGCKMIGEDHRERGTLQGANTYKVELINDMKW